MRKIEVLSKGLSAQKSPTGAAGLSTISAQNRSPLQRTLRTKVAYGCSRTKHNKCAKSKSSPKDSPHKSRLLCSRTKHNKCAKSKSPPKDYPCKSRLRAQPDQDSKAPTRAAGLAQQKNQKHFPKGSPCTSRLQARPGQRRHIASYKSRVHTYNEGITRYIGSTLGIMPISL
jgi:hypothetical protein